jgi:two-component system, sensor histidine kinase and response regulator
MFGGAQTEVPSPRQVLPFAAAALLGLLSVLLPGPPTDWTMYAVAVGLNVALVAVGLVVSRLPHARALVGLLPIGYIVIVALLRHSSIGAASGYQPLFLLPIVWLALFGSRGQLIAGIVALAVAQLVPFAIYGGPRYPETALRSALLWVAVAVLTGMVVQQLVAETRAARDRVEALLTAATGTSIIAADPAGTITLFNRGATLMLGYQPEEVVGRATPALIHDDAEVAERAAEMGIAPGFEVFVAAARRGEVETREWTYVRKDGERLRVALTVTAERALDGSITSYLGVATDITERVRAEEAAMEASRAKSEFLANMSHEIRTPLNGVIGMLQLLSDSDLDHDQREYAETASRSGEALLVVINDILDFSKVEAGRLELDPHDFDLRKAVEDTCEMLAGQAHAKGLELTCWLADGLPAMVHGDGGRLRQILTNLLSNAIKFTSAGEVGVRVDADVTGDEVLVRAEVVDTGMGIDPDRLAALFEPFSQADASTTRRFGGTGLGLAISKQLTELMGGELTAESERGRGSTFRFTARLAPSTVERITRRQRTPLPPELRVLVVDDNATNRAIVSAYLQPRVAVCHTSGSAPEALLRLREAARAGQAYDVVVLDYQMPEMDGLTLARTIRRTPGIERTALVLLASVGVSRDTVRQAQIDTQLVKPARRAALLEAVAEAVATEAEPDVAEPAPEPVADGPAHGAAVLVAEDNPVNQLVITSMLERRGVSADIASNGREAIAALDPGRHAAVFMDCQMPEVDGYAATEAIRSGPALARRVPIIAMTAHAMEGDRERCLAAGMDDYLSKPIRQEDVDAMLERWIGAASPAVPAAPAADGNGGGGDPLIDESRIEGFRRDYPDMARQLVTLFADTTPPLLAELRDAAARGDGPAAAQAAHKLKGSSQNVGALRMAEIAMRLEQGDLDVGTVDALDAAYARTLDALRAGGGPG